MQDVPLHLGTPEFDGGERFDLRAPYADEGYVDEEAGGSAQLLHAATVRQ
jgi:hypothetical protein